jgi:hypothetical protein
MGRIFFLVFLCLLACNGSGDAGDAGTPLGGAGGGDALPPGGLLIGEATGGAAPNELVRALCEWIDECQFPTYRDLSMEECLIYFSQPCFMYVSIEEQDGLAECLAWARDFSCTEDVADSECVDLLARARARRIGTSVQTTEGGQCGAGVACGRGMLCSSFTDACGMCIGYAKVGESCASKDCWDGYCDAGTEVCMPMKEDGEACSTASECDGIECNNEGVCQDFLDRSCTEDDDCGPGRCVDGECAEWAPIGGACAANSDCALGAGCDAGKCKIVVRCALGEVGEPCGISSCRGGLACIDNTCVEPAEPARPNGAECTSAHDCQSGYCVIDILQAPPWVCGLKQGNATCDADEQCESDSCIDFRCASAATCTP